MEQSTREYINALAQRVIEVYEIEIPISSKFEDIEAVVKKIGGCIDIKEKFDDLCDGTIIKKPDGSFQIAISKHRPPQRQAFTIAHELGHLFLHMGYRTNTALWEAQDQKVFRRFGSSEQEYQANEFAAALLMPREKYEEILLRNKNKLEDGYDIGAVADHFHVSKAAALNRGRFLGYLK